MDKNKLSEWKKKFIYSDNYIWAIGINVLALVVILMFCDLKYEVSDDFVMSTIMSGAYNKGEPNPHMIFINVIIGYILVPLYKLFPQISWYFIFQLLLLLVTFIMVSYMFLEKNGKATGTFLTIVMLGFFAFDAYILMQFTKTAAVVVMGTAVVFIWSLFEGRKKSLTVLSGIICLLGTMIRFPSVYLAGAFILLILLIEYIRLFRQGIKVNIKKGIMIAACGIGLISISFGLMKIDTIIYDTNEEYKYFREYGEARTDIVDVADYGYEAYREELEKIGVSENDYWNLRRWNFADQDEYTVERMTEIGRVLAQKNQEKTVPLGDIYESMQVRKILNYPGVIACILIMAMTIFLQKYNWLFSGAALGIAVVLESYFFSVERIVYRVEYGIFLCAFLCMSYFWSKKQLRFQDCRKEISKAVIILSGVLCIWKAPLLLENSSYVGVPSEERKAYLDQVFYDSWSYDARKYRKVVNKDKPENKLIQEIENHKDNFYFLDFRTTVQTLYFEWNPFENVSNNFYENCLYFAGVMSEFPEVSEIAKKNGIDNYFKALVQDNVYIVDNEGAETKLLYLKEHYYPNARKELYKEISGYQVWKFYES